MNKIFGFILLLLSGFTAVQMLKNGYKERKAMLKGVFKGIENIISGISIMNKSIPILFRELSEKGEKSDRFFKIISEEAELGNGIERGFERAMDEDIFLEKSDYELISDLKDSLGERDKKEQIEALKSVRERVFSKIEEISHEEKNKLKYGSALIFSSVLCLGILLL